MKDEVVASRRHECPPWKPHIITDAVTRVKPSTPTIFLVTKPFKSYKCSEGRLPILQLTVSVHTCVHMHHLIVFR